LRSRLDLDLAFGSEPIEKKFLVSTQSPSDPLHGFDTAAQRSAEREYPLIKDGKYLDSWKWLSVNNEPALPLIVIDH
jgi:hypothetical protein